MALLDVLCNLVGILALIALGFVFVLFIVLMGRVIIGILSDQWPF